MDLPTTKMVVSKRWKVFHKTSFNFGTVTGNEIKTESNREKDAASWSTFFLLFLGIVAYYQQSLGQHAKISTFL